MNNLLFSNIGRFLGLVLVQVLICNQMDFLGHLNPFIYVLFILIYPVGTNRLQFLFWCFIIGIIIDHFLDTGGAHAAASVTMAYIRPFFLKFAFGAAYEYQAIKFGQAEFFPRLTYFGFLIVIHHLLLFSLLFFDIDKLDLIISNALSSSAFTLFLALLLSGLFSTKES